MTTISAFTALPSIFRAKTGAQRLISSHSLALPVRSLPNQTNLTLRISERRKNGVNGVRRLRSVEEETALVEEETEQGQETVAADEQEQEQHPVSVPVSPSDKLTMFFQADGTMNETAIPTVTEALEKTEHIADLKVQIVEGIATVELKKQTTVQATGVASNLVEIIQGAGFKLQTLNLSFEDEEDVLV